MGWGSRLVSVWCVLVSSVVVVVCVVGRVGERRRKIERKILENKGIMNCFPTLRSGGPEILSICTKVERHSWKI